MARYPQATLIDIYKFFFQGAFGPGHMIPDAAAARQYLENELQQATSFDSTRWYPVGYQQEFYRVHLSMIKDGEISSGDLLQAFVESANAVVGPSLREWQEEWAMILKVVEKHRGQLADFDADKVRLAEMLGRDEIVAHHSPIFEEKYHPHYRVVHRSHMERLRSARHDD